MNYTPRLLSVVMAAHRADRWIGAALDSIFSQALPVGWSMEVLVGVDECPATLASLERVDHQELTVVEMERNVGTYVVANTLLTLARGEVFTRFDADDVMLPGRLATMLAAIERGADCANSLYADTGPDLEHPKRRGTPANGAWMWRRSSWDRALGGFIHWMISGDAEVMARARANSLWLAPISKVQMLRRRTTTQLTRDTDTGVGTPGRVGYGEALAADYVRYRAGDVPAPITPVTAGYTVVRTGRPAPEIAATEPRRRPMIVASMATLASRQDLLELSLASLLPQVDAVCLYLNGHPHPPAFARHPKVMHAILSRDAGWRGGEAKLWFWDPDEFKQSPYWPEDTVVLTCDDDIIYPADYAEKMVAALDRHPGSMVCVHGAILADPITSYRDARRTAKFMNGLEEDARVHVPGTGTAAFRLGTPRISMRDFTWSHADDPLMGIICKRAGVDIWAVARPQGWLQGMAPPPGTGVFANRVGARNDSVETQMIRDAAPWEALPIPPGFSEPPRAANSTMNPEDRRARRDRIRAERQAAREARRRQ